jgi:membrane-bound lytic murein transglycosylase B
MKRVGSVLAVVLLWLQVSPAMADERGWQYLMDKLVADGVDRGRVVAAFRDWHVEPFTKLGFSANPPHEARTLYRRFLRPTTIAAARRCRINQAYAFEAAERRYGVSANVLAAIFYIESGCGHNTGSSVIFYRLARLAMANAPDNLQRILERWTTEDGRLDADIAARLRARAQYLERTFYPEVRALFDVAERMGVSPLDIRGSGSGAFGYPQFLPRSYLEYGVDADGDGRVSLYDTADAAASCARYFAGHGWQPGSSQTQRRTAVWQYNHSDAYVDTVLTLAARLNQAPIVRVKQRAPQFRSKHHQQRAATSHKRKANG